MNYISNLKQPRGFTLIELMVTISIMAIVVSLAVPSFNTTIENRRVLTINEMLAASLKLARSEALSRSESITMCFSSDQTTCSGSWSDGWIIYVDENSDRIFDGGIDELLKASDEVAPNYSIELMSNVISSFQFNNEGRAVESGTYRVCGPAADDNRARGVIINLSGGMRFSTDSNSDGVRETHTGSNISC